MAHEFICLYDHIDQRNNIWKNDNAQHTNIKKRKIIIIIIFDVRGT